MLSAIVSFYSGTRIWLNGKSYNIIKNSIFFVGPPGRLLTSESLTSYAF
jgi:hypothetical protein